MAPAGVIVLTTLSISLLGDWLRDRLALSYKNHAMSAVRTSTATRRPQYRNAWALGSPRMPDPLSHPFPT